MSRTAVLGTLAVNVVANTGGVTLGVTKARVQFRGLVQQTPGVLSSLSGISAGFLGVSGGAVAAALAVRGMVSASREFTRSMAQSTAIMADISGPLRAKMEQTARAVAFQTKFATAEAAKAYFFLASAGLDATQSIGALPIVAQFAQAGTFDLSLATDLLTDAQSALGLASKDTQENLLGMSRVGNVLVKANTLANASVEQFSRALTTKAGAAMKAYGVDVEQGVAVLAALADQGVKGQEAGTQFSIVIRDLTTKALENEAAFKRNNVAVFDGNRNLRNMADIIGDLERQLKGLSTAGQKQLLLDLGFSDKSMGSLLTLLGTSDKIRQYEQGLRDAGDVMSDVAKKNIPALDEGLHKLHVAWENFSIAIATPALDALGRSIIFVTKVLQGKHGALVKVVAEVTTFSVVLGVALAVIPKVVAAIAAIYRITKSLIAGQLTLNALIGPAGWAKIAAGAAIATGAVYALDQAFAGLDEQVASAVTNAEKAAQAAQGVKPNAAQAQAELAAKQAEEQAKKVQDAMKRLADEGKRVAESVRTPMQIARDEMAKLNLLVITGAITWDTYRRAVGKTRDELVEAQERLQKLNDRNRGGNAAVERGSTAAFEAVHEGREQMQRLLDLEAKKLKLQQEANKFLQEISVAGKTRPDPVTILKTSIP